MVSPNTQKIFVIIIVLLLMGFLAFQLITREAEVVDESMIELSSTEKAGQEILALVNKLNTVEIDQSFFRSNLFINLRDFSQAVFPEAKGRTNPFAVVGSDGSFTVVAPVATTTNPR